MSKKDVPRGTYKVAPGQKVWDASDDSHVSRVTPLETKRRELQNDPRYVTKAAPGTEREKNTTRRRADKETRPL